MTFRGSHLYVNGPEIQGVFGVTSLPLTTVAQIISYLDGDVASLARLCRTSRSLYYMTVPHLWRSVTLTSYTSIRYKDDVPEGFGSASPFSMGLNALVTRNVSNLVRSLRLMGDFGGSDQQENSKAGRISEYGMILNIAVSAALEKCTQVEDFRWNLDARIQPNVYSSLARLSNLQSLWLEFPRTRTPHPISDLPPLKNLRSFTMTNYDPLCHPDDISTLLLHGDKLSNVQMHFSPRMRDQGEPSVIFPHFFRRLVMAKKQLKIARLGVYNLLASMDAAVCMSVLDTTYCEDFTAINSFGFDEDAFTAPSNATYFIDRTWLVPFEQIDKPKPKTLRVDQLHKRHALELQRAAGLEHLYLVNARHKPEGVNGYSQSHSTPNSAGASPYALSASGSGSGSGSRSSSRSTPTPNNSLRDLYMDNICNVCGPSLKHLILPSRWPLHQTSLARLIRSAPNLTQLSAALMCSNMQVTRMLMPFLGKLYAIRLLSPTQEGAEGDKLRCEFERFVSGDDEHHIQKFSEELGGTTASGGKSEFPRLRYVGLGPKVWLIGGIIDETVVVPSGDEETKGAGEIRYRRRVTRISESEVMDVEIWKMDSLDVI
ncbi:hypothetical protein LTR84_009154 [Exophiala bonariae]|uniref:F-box domain-containing protein n=1 Tax=Exophiala bonariae TaxID=1690606 RepID=A0AAV9MVT5_9EURO|nr:hypothetical protein LTR84_009154 [Exophiala bonariae]